jgi:hypothetical protein
MIQLPEAVEGDRRVTIRTSPVGFRYAISAYATLRAPTSWGRVGA